MSSLELFSSQNGSTEILILSVTAGVNWARIPSIAEIFWLDVSKVVPQLGDI